MVAGAMIAGFTLGAAGSLHCIGMCGPLSLALPTHQLSPGNKFLSLLLYQIGRIITYSTIGLLFGLAGHRLYLAGYQQKLSITLGALILLFSVYHFLQKKTIRLSFLNERYKMVLKLISRVLKFVKGPSSFLFLGMANGLLPCGMVYVALAGIFTFTTLKDSVVYMAMFGAGTLPAMMLVAYAGQFVKPRIRSSVRKIVPVFITLMGLLLIFRGLNLGIPFLSPALPVSPEQAAICHP